MCDFVWANICLVEGALNRTNCQAERLPLVSLHSGMGCWPVIVLVLTRGIERYLMVVMNRYCRTNVACAYSNADRCRDWCRFLHVFSDNQVSLVDTRMCKDTFKPVSVIALSHSVCKRCGMQRQLL